MSNLVIVAIPEEEDYINRISSEKVPHMTLLFLGEDASKVKNISKILDFTKHAADQTLTRFSMEVDHRGVLGPDEADTLFFKKSKWSGFDTINTFRSNLLKDNNIRTAYDSAVQFPEWIPHITLGYPATPANPDERDYPKTYSVCFDRIAVWFADYDGIEFPLKDYEFDEMAMGSLATKDILAHHGIKGMKWGVRSGINRAYDIKVSNRAARLHRVAEGKGSKTDNIKTALTISGHSVAKAKGNVRKASFDKAVREEQHLQRVRNGEATTRDILKKAGGVSLLNIRDLQKAKAAA